MLIFGNGKKKRKVKCGQTKYLKVCISGNCFVSKVVHCFSETKQGHFMWQQFFQLKSPIYFGREHAKCRSLLELHIFLWDIHFAWFVFVTFNSLIFTHIRSDFFVDICYLCSFLLRVGHVSLCYHYKLPLMHIVTSTLIDDEIFYSTSRSSSSIRLNIEEFQLFVWYLVWYIFH